MIETPPSFAATPDIDRGGDLLADMLRSIRLSGSVFLNASLTEPFGLISPKHFDERTPMAHLRHVSIFHLIAAGECTVELASGERGTIAAGDVLLMPFADTHRFYSGDGAELCSAMELVRAGPLSGMWTIEHGGGGRETRMVCGFIEIVGVAAFSGLSNPAADADRSRRRRQGECGSRHDGARNSLTDRRCDARQ
ncbi:cupin domain-containing protein [Tardiphaga sp. 709]|nr:cupin domain-containing protein [Tardiphaga sp. 709]WNV10422.1 cupin domain-containing protein [Tardiphaga sp. 709]